MNRKTTVLHIEGAWDIPVRTCLFAAACVVGGMLAVSCVSKICLSAKYRKKYARKYREKLLRAQAMHPTDRLRADKVTGRAANV